MFKRSLLSAETENWFSSKLSGDASFHCHLLSSLRENGPWNLEGNKASDVIYSTERRGLLALSLPALSLLHLGFMGNLGHCHEIPTQVRSVSHL